MLNPSLKSRFMEEFNRFSRILASLVGYKIYPLENKNVPKIKNVKNAFFIKIINNVKTFFTSMVSLSHCLILFYSLTVSLSYYLILFYSLIVSLSHCHILFYSLTSQ